MSDGREAENGSDLVVPVLAEQLKVDIVGVTTGSVRIIKRVVEEDVVIEEQLQTQNAEVWRLPINRVVDGPQPMRQTDNELIIPIVEEQLVVERRWLLKEEVHVARSESYSTYRKTVTLKREEVHVERLDP